MVAPERLLKTRQVAEALGVSASTIKRWVDSGALEATRTVGKHRLVSLDEAIRFARSKNVSPERLAALQSLGGRTLLRVDDAVRDALILALRRGRAAEARRLIVEAHAVLGDGARLADELIRPAMERVGHDWSVGALDVFQEHRASRIVESALTTSIARLSARPVSPGAPVALGATPEGDLYTLSGLLCELALRELGWDVVNLGPNLPLASLAKAVRVHRPRLVWLSINHLADPARFVREYSAFHGAASACGAAVCLGGPALDAALRSRLIAASLGDRVAHLAEFARRLAPPPWPSPTPPRADFPSLDDSNGPDPRD